MSMPTPIQPEDLKPEDLSLVPDAPQERTATALLALLSGVADQLGIPPTELASLQGVVLDNGSVGVFGRLPHPGAMEFTAHVVGSWWAHKGDGGGFQAVEYTSSDEAARLYEAIVARLSGEADER